MANAAYKLDWNGPAVKKAAIDAMAIGMTEVMSEAVVDAKRTPDEGGTMPFRFGFLQGSIQMRPPVLDGGKLVGYWGSFDIPYARHQELGTQTGVDKRGIFRTGITEKRFLRNAADTWYPTLTGRAANHFNTLAP